MSRDVLLTDVWGYQHVTCRGIDLVIGFVSPASTPSQEGIRRGIEILAGWGLRVETGTHAFDTRDHYLAGRDEDRLADINDALRHPGIRAIPCHHWRQGRVPHDRTTDTIALDQIERILI